MPTDVLAFLTPKPGAAARVEEILVQAAAAVQANEPGTLRYHLHKEVNAKGEVGALIVMET